MSDYEFQKHFLSAVMLWTSLVLCNWVFCFVLLFSFNKIASS